MAREHIVVDGSNIATEGRSAPSLAQLENAVAELRRERPEAEVTVVVDATFSHRIDQSELARFEEAALKGDYVHPPAGAIGRGDAFLLRIAEKIDATVLSNDSFQEFHGEHPWLFDRGRLFGATPVPGIGWIFSPRTPVRGPKSRRAVRETGGDDKAKRRVSKAIEAATKEAVDPKRPAKKEPAGRTAGRRQPTVVATAAAVNDPLTFVSFIADHPLGTEVSGQVDSYTSHGAVVMVDSTQCYLPLANMAEPPPRSAREVVKKKEVRSFVVVALDPQRRGVELALPGVAAVSGRPSEETIAAELRLAKKKAAPAKKAAKKATAEPADRGAAKRAAGRKAAKETPPAPLPAGAPTEEKAAPAKKAAKKATPEKAPAKRAAGGTRSATGAEKAQPKKAAGGRTAASSKKAAAGTKAAPAEKTASSKKAAARKKAAPAKKAAPGEEAPPSPAPAVPRRNPRRSSR